MRTRRQKVTDDEVFAAAQRAMMRRGPHELTLADIGAEAGVTAGRLVQRYGGKRELLLALSARFAHSAEPIFAGLRSAHGTPLATLRAYAACMADLAPTPDALLRNLAYLQLDLADAALRSHLVDNARATRRQIEKLIRAAVAAGELHDGADERSLARIVETVISGSLMTWACYQEGLAREWIRRDLEAVLRPHLSDRPGTSSPTRGPRAKGRRAR